MATTSGGFRAWFGLELADRDRHAIAGWLSGALDCESITVPGADELTVTGVSLAGRHRRVLSGLARMLPGLETRPVTVRFGASLLALPSRRRPELYSLEARCDGLDELLRRLAEKVPGTLGTLRPDRATPYLPVGWRKESAQGPDRWPRELPGSLRGPFDAVRLGLYCSQIKPEQKRLNPLAQVKLPVAAAVR